MRGCETEHGENKFDLAKKEWHEIYAIYFSVEMRRSVILFPVDDLVHYPKEASKPTLLLVQ